MGTCPYVVAVASEKGGVGKTTLATNLAVYLKALCEDLPVTIASFDNHFSVDGMFAIGGHRGPSVAGLFEGQPVGELVCLGEYGVQFIASAGELVPPPQPEAVLRSALAVSGLGGIVILDTRPILDYFTRSALQCADLVLVPVKDRPSLVNAASVQKALVAGGGQEGRMWLVPSLVDSRLKLRGTIGMAEFLTFSARERGYQVVDTFLSKSPKVEGLATNLTSRVYPVLTHARSTVVHRQFRQVAEFVLNLRREQPYPSRLLPRGLPDGSGEESSLARRRTVAECPVCARPSHATSGELFFHLQSRRRGLIHSDCLARLLEGSELSSLLVSAGAGVLALETVEDDQAPDRWCAVLHLFDAQGEEIVRERPGPEVEILAGDFWKGVTGRLPQELYRELVLLFLDRDTLANWQGADGQARQRRLRRRVLRRIFGSAEG